MSQLFRFRVEDKVNPYKGDRRLLNQQGLSIQEAKATGYNSQERNKLPKPDTPK
jgi:hypothetical protein